MFEKIKVAWPVLRYVVSPTRVEFSGHENYGLIWRRIAQLEDYMRDKHNCRHPFYGVAAVGTYARFYQWDYNSKLSWTCHPSCLLIWRSFWTWSVRPCGQVSDRNFCAWHLSTEDESNFLGNMPGQPQDTWFTSSTSLIGASSRTPSKVIITLCWD